MIFHCYPILAGRADFDVEVETEADYPAKAAEAFCGRNGIVAIGDTHQVLVTPADETTRAAWQWQQHFGREGLVFSCRAEVTWTATAMAEGAAK